jgi:2-polyprenyl-6-hydroxyphenyl methylase/3-demethylubiquinone-9 3-methyltransferase
MSIYHDWIDWLGGYPFEVAKVDEIFVFYFEKQFLLFNIKTSCGLGNNQFVFKKSE